MGLIQSIKAPKHLKDLTVIDLVLQGPKGPLGDRSCAPRPKGPHGNGSCAPRMLDGTLKDLSCKRRLVLCFIHNLGYPWFELFVATPYYDDTLCLSEADLVSWCACEYGNQVVYLHKPHLRTTLELITASRMHWRAGSSKSENSVFLHILSKE